MPDNPFSLAVKAFVANEQDEILLIQRSRLSKHFKEKWDLPGGKVDAGESFHAALIREVKEETGLDVELVRTVGACQDDMETVHVVILFLEARIVSGTLRLSEEHDASAWVARADLAGVDLSEQLRDFVLAHAES